MALDRGKTLGPYEIVELRGSGGMGEVYRARDTRLGRDVALKVLPSEVGENPSFKERFALEAKTISQLQHANICALYDVLDEEGMDVLVMEYLDGETLEERLQSGAIPFEEMIVLVSQVVSAIAAAHAKGIVHRDLKPGNVMLTPNGAKVLDFGLARELNVDLDYSTQAATMQAITTEGSIIGTMPYMAPEQLRGERADHRSDIWALGCLIYEAATGARPFSGKSQADLVSSILSQQPTPPSKRLGKLPPRIDGLIERCLAKAPDQRWQSCQDVALELESLGVARSAGSSRAKLSKVVFAVAVAVALIASGTVVWVLNQDTSSMGPVVAEAGAPVRMVVVPFENLGPSEHEAFAIGLADEIGTGLARLEGLEVTSRFSTRQYTSGDMSLQQMGEELGIGYALVGSVRYAPGDRIRVTPTLVRIADETQLWSEPFDRTLRVEDILEIQSEISRQVSDQLNLVLLESTTASVRGSTTIEAAYVAYLQGVEAEGRKNRREALRAAGQLYERAIELDPDFALAWADLGLVRSELFFWGDRSAEQIAKAEAAIQRAIELAPDLPQTRRARGMYFSVIVRDPEKAYQERSAAAAGLPNDSNLLSDMAFNLQQIGRWEEGVELRERAIRLDPRSTTALLDQAWTVGNMRRFEHSDRLHQRVLELEPGLPAARRQRSHYNLLWKGYAASDGLEHSPLNAAFVSHALGRYREALALYDALEEREQFSNNRFVPTALFHAWVYRDMGRLDLAHSEYEKALGVLTEALEATPQDERVHSSLGLTYAGLGLEAEAIRHGQRGRELMMAPTRNDVQGAHRVYDLARIQAQVGEPQQALALIEELLTMPGQFTVHVVEAEGAFDSLRDLPEYVALIERFSSLVEPAI